MPPKCKRKFNEKDDEVNLKSSKRLKDKLKNEKSSVYFKKEIQQSKTSPKKKDTKSSYFELTKDDFENNQSDSSSTDFKESDSSDEKEDWEEVEDAKLEEDEEELIRNYKPILPENGVDIVLDLPNAEKKKKNKLTADEMIRQQINRMKKSLHIAIHKTHLLCLLASGFYLNSLTLKNFISSLALSHLTTFQFNIKTVTIKQIQDFSVWFQQYFDRKKFQQTYTTIEQSLINSFQTSSINNDLEYVLMYLTCLRVWLPHAQFRLCFAMNPLSIKPSDLLLSDKQRQRQQSSKKKKKKSIVETESGKTKANKKDEEAKENSNITQLWIEFYYDSEKKWVCVDPVNLIFDEPKQIEKSSYNLLLYVIAYNDHNLVKEVTARYSSDWCTNKLQKMRAEKDWWKDSLKSFVIKNQSSQEKEEDRQLEEALSMKPLPQSITEYKNHPLYVLNRHLLKYEVIYPQRPPIGYLRGEPVYSRSNVQPVHTKEYWKRQAKVIKENEEPFKTSIARKKWDKNSASFITNLPQHLYGEWQTEPFVPPVAKDGKVPRSEFGNVELFQPCMLPVGCVHLQLPGLLRIANKLKIDCAPVVVGFDNNSSGSVIPIFDGFAVCEEFKDILIAAWDEEEENAKFRKKSVKERRALKNWKRLYKVLMIRERLIQKYKSEFQGVVKVLKDE